MFESRSAVYKMLLEAASKDRTIHEFPKPYSLDCTPYKDCDFSDLVKNACLNGLNLHTPIITGLKICKVIVLGDVAVGKTSLVNRFCHQDFDNNYKATIGVDFEVERFDILNIPFNVQIWDTAGQERFKCIAQSYYRSSHIVILVFDLCNLMTLSNCKKWLDDALKVSQDPIIFLVGTKKDLMGNAAYEGVERHIMKVAKELNAEYWPVSARSGDGVHDLFERMAALAFNDLVEQERESVINAVKIGSDLVTLKNSQKEVTTKKPFCVIGCS
ncbi:ras-related protein Rab-34 [Chrysoperla carnea]|uniref:ras-related protein Rab-34 n=1 Tax=Chrysoperla carnea TaxID=189513 RepID=UPI001D08AB99|nr:ras-related protein Rab-34 [Chrysoperla carnea]